MIEEDEVEFPRIETATDCCGRLRRFMVDLLTTDGGYFLRAQEDAEDGTGYHFAAHSDTSRYLALGRLRQRIREGLATRYLSFEDGTRRLGHDVAVGTIGFGSVLIDGQDIPFDEFLMILQSYEGWQFSLRIADVYDAL
jgi:hypothetical protein